MPTLAEQIQALRPDNPEECHRIDAGHDEAKAAAAALAEQWQREQARVIERLEGLYRAERKAREGDLRTLQCIAPYICNKSADYANDKLREYDAATESAIREAKGEV